MTEAAKAKAIAPQEIADQRVRDRIRNDLDTTLVVEAAAGTGKTTALVNRIVAALARGRAELGRIVAVTFTEKAAGELKLRLRAEIESARSDPARPASERKRLSGALGQLEEARIGTIHSFCADLLRERPVDARVDPMFEVAADDVAGELFESAFDRWFEQALAAPGEGLRRLLRRREGFDREGPRPIIRAAAWELLQWRDFDSPWRHQAFDRDPQIDALVEEIRALGALAERVDPEDWLGKALAEIARPIDEATRLETVRGRDYDALEAALLALLRGYDGRWRWKGWGENFAALPRAEVMARRGALHARLTRFRDAAGANLAPLLRDELWPIVGYYEDAKKRAGVLDFIDLLLVARDLVRDRAAVRAELQQRISHIFVDEFQDTDPLQAEILLLLAAADCAESDWHRVRPLPGKLFIVGDPKQSIYRFRRADVALYQDVKRRLLECGAELEHLTVSFRATPELQRAVNAAFAPLMPSESPTQPAYSPLMPFRADCPTQPSIVVLPVPTPYNERGYVTKRAIDESTPDAAGALVRWLVEESGWTVTTRERPEQRVAIEPRHICMLFRRFSSYGRDITRPYMRALEARHIAHVLVKGGSFNEREEVEALRNALGAIERPDDELGVFATLRGPLFALDDGALLRFRAAAGSLHPFRKLPADLPAELKEIADALTVLRELSRGRNRRPIAETIGRLLAAVRAHAAIAIWPTGEQALANVMRLMDLARRYEARRAVRSFRGFVDELQARAEREESGDAPVVEEGAEGVRIMTVHRAKGLEFPIVLLADLTCNETAGDAHRWVDPASGLCAQRLAGHAPRELLDHAEEETRRDCEEAMRLLYVGATRARDLLIVPAVGSAPQEGWLGRLNPVIYPALKDWRVPLEPVPPGCPVFGDDSVVVRPPKAPAKSRAVAPGLHRAEAGEHHVVWWDPARLRLDARETMGLRQHRLLTADKGERAASAGAHEYEQWKTRHGATLKAGAAETFKVVMATELAARIVKRGAPPGWLGDPDRIAIERVARAAARPHGVRFGTLVHAILSRVALDADAAAIAEAARFFARMLGADDAEMTAACAAVTAAIAAPLMKAAAAAGPELRRECALVLKLLKDPAIESAPTDGVTLEGVTVEGVTVEGIVDLAFRERVAGDPGWVVVDFKTDADIAGRLDEYRVQLLLYLRAISQSTGAPARGVLMCV
ncbi:MAG TPA: UvrD-helicase domain-containing protein [Candidatus Binataceae bacterium]|jgi:ATP-dependent exoDNAse (exonuclease V) beta subunit|nr:UvrD-helicase domain-containing protein [Candidatus Binataceae bacterium]